jgi:3-deoxy-7-phosphoheptulonate synthase
LRQRQSRQTAADIISGRDKRLLVIVGPCSIHDVSGALEYAALLKAAAHQFADTLFIVMRVYFEKPRTILGWKGLINDPHLDNTFDIHYGLRSARKLLLELIALGIPTATEFLDTIIPQYLSDLICWSAVGARTVESQTHRELASGLSMPVGFKNTTDGNIKIAIDGVISAGHAHHFLSISKQGIASVVHTSGNPDCHIILRGSNHSTNYSPQDIQQATQALQQKNLPPYLIVDCSHGNSMKNHSQQHVVVNTLVEQMQAGVKAIRGVMLESYLVAGKQTLTRGEPLIYGQSITDACLSWDETQELLERLSSHAILT